MSFDNLSSDDLPSFFYLTILAIILISSVVVRGRANLSVVVKQVLGWVAIAAVMLLGYSFRHDFNNFKNRIHAELFPSKAIINDQQQIVIRISNNDHYYIDLKLNNVPVRFMVDTGASDVALSSKDARRVGIDIGNLSFNKRYQTANGTIYGAKVIIDQVEMGNLIFNDVPVSVSGGDMGTSLLGMSFLRQFQSYEFQGDSLILTY